MRLLIAKIANHSIYIIKKPFWFFYSHILFFLQNIEYKDMPSISGVMLLKNRGKVIIGKNLKISSNRYGNPVGCCEKTAIFCSPNGKIIIGNNVSISSSLIFSQNCITIEDYVMIGGGAQIWDTDFHPINLNQRIIHDVSKIETKPVFLKKGCFIGANSIILKGCTIGENSIIGAGSVVTKNVPDNEIWGGNPARLIKKLNDQVLNSYGI